MEQEKRINWKLLFVVLLGIFVLAQFFNVNFRTLFGSAKNQQAGIIEILESKEGITLPVKWGNLVRQMIELGVIDTEKYEKALLYADNNGYIEINSQNSRVVLNLLWAFGLANKNPILEQGPMQTRYGSAEKFASAGGWTLAKGDAMNHYSQYQFVVLTKEQQDLVEKVSKNIYRPCCGNSVYFPDCNHGMAMLGLLELLAAKGASEKEMYKIALQVNSYWFPSTYLTLAKYFQRRGVEWKDVEPRIVLGSAYSSVLGYREILKEVEPAQFQGGRGCGV